jgi:hypothetical protein
VTAPVEGTRVNGKSRTERVFAGGLWIVLLAFGGAVLLGIVIAVAASAISGRPQQVAKPNATAAAPGAEAMTASPSRASAASPPESPSSKLR